MKILKRMLFVGLATLSWGAAAEINLNLAPATLPFGDVELGSPASGVAIIGINFNGAGDLNGQANNGSVTSISVLNDATGFFSASPACVGFAFSANTPDDTCNVVVQCAPNTTGVSTTAELEVQFERNNGSAADVATVALSCSGIVGTTPPPGADGAQGIPALGGLGIGLLGLLIGGAGLLGVSRSSRRH